MMHHLSADEEKLPLVHLHPYEAELLAQAIEADARKSMNEGNGETHDLMMCRASTVRQEVGA